VVHGKSFRNLRRNLPAAQGCGSFLSGRLWEYNADGTDDCGGWLNFISVVLLRDLADAETSIDAPKAEA
jgi:hypothetical protein